MRKSASVFTLAILVAAWMSLANLGCKTDYADALIGADGTPITLDQISKIMNNADISTEEKRQALRDLGIDDETIIDFIIRDFTG